MGPHVLDISDEAWESHASFSAFAFRNVPSISRSLAAQTDCEILQCRRQAVQPPAPAPFQSLSFHATLSVPETAAPELEHFPDWYWGCLSWQCHAIVCTCLHIWYFAASVGILHKDQTMINLERNVYRFALIGCQCGKVLVFKDQNVRRWLWAWQLSMSKRIPLSLCVPYGIFATLQTLRLKASSSFRELSCTYLMPIQINPTTTLINFGHSNIQYKWTLDQDRKRNTSRKRWANMQLGSLAFTILVFRKIWVLMAHHVGLCKRLHQEALENVFEDGDCRCTLLKTRRYPPFKLPHFWSWRCWPKIQRWSFGFADSTSRSGEISVTRKRFQTKIHLATDNVSWYFLGILYCTMAISGHPYSPGWQSLLFYWAQMMVIIPTLLYVSEVLRRAINAILEGLGSLISKSDPEKHLYSRRLIPTLRLCSRHARTVVT